MPLTLAQLAAFARRADLSALDRAAQSRRFLLTDLPKRLGACLSVPGLDTPSVALERFRGHVRGVPVSLVDEASVDTTCAAMQEWLETDWSALVSECSTALTQRPLINALLFQTLSQVVRLRVILQEHARLVHDAHSRTPSRCPVGRINVHDLIAETIEQVEHFCVEKHGACPPIVVDGTGHLSSPTIVCHPGHVHFVLYVQSRTRWIAATLS